MAEVPQGAYGLMATYQAGNRSRRERPWLARVWTKGRHKPPMYLGYYATRHEAEEAEEIIRRALMPVATPNPDTNIESVMSTCMTPGCNQPIVTVKMGDEWSDWAHALTGVPECVVGAPEPPPTERAN
jgi:hypothetical protein